MPGSGSQTRARSEVVMVRLTPDEKQRFAALAQLHHATLPELFRLSVEWALIQEAMHA